jgi:membrane-bound serine protease (ClpP class)
VYVAPRGAIAGSAGTVITLAGHAAAMAPQTAIGAASPVGSQGEDIGDTLESKIKQIIRAQIRTLAQDRPPEAIAAAEDTVENASALTAGEALQVGLVDYIAEDVPDLLRQLDGRTVIVAGEERTLNTEYLTINRVEPSMLEDLLDILTDPNIVFLLLSLGLQAILIEIGSPGGWFAGFLGVVSLSLAAYGLGILPVNYFGLIFILTSFVLFFLEIKAPTHGALVAAGLISFIVGALVLFNSGDTPAELRVSVPLVIATGLVSAGSFIAALTFAIRAQKTPQRMGGKSLLGKIGVARTAIPRDGQGEVHLGGEMWTAELAEGEKEIKEGERVQVERVEGLRLIVKRK